MVAIELILGIVIPLLLILVGLMAGRVTERRHLRQLLRREEEMGGVAVTDIKQFPLHDASSPGAILVHAEVVIATDYFKTFAARIRQTFGGEIRSYGALMMRARREALLRLKEQAMGMNLNTICNLRMDTADIGGTFGRGTTTVCVVAIGTAYRMRQSP